MKREKQTDLHKHATLTVSVFLKIKMKGKKEKTAQKPFLSPISCVCWVVGRLSLDNSQQAALSVSLQTLTERPHQWQELDCCSLWGYSVGLSRQGKSMQNTINCSGMPIPKWRHQGRGVRSYRNKLLHSQSRSNLNRNYLNDYFN